MFSFIFKCFLIPFMISSLIHWLCKSVLFSFHKFVNFPVLLFFPFQVFINKHKLVGYVSVSISFLNSVL